MTGQPVRRKPGSQDRSSTRLFVLARAAALLPPIVGQLHRLAQIAAVRLLIGRLLLCVAMVVQVVLLLVVAYMVDLSISLMELWAELARKHLELTL